jgi:hypothetical protein
MIISILQICHIYACFWIYLGDKYLLGDSGDPWLIANAEDFGSYNDRQIYVFSYYWIMETVSTVGFGDYAGGTKAEYLFSMIVEFSGITLTAILMFQMERVTKQEFSFDTYIRDKYQSLDIWITKIEKSN